MKSFDKKNIYEVVTSQIIGLLEQHKQSGYSLPWFNLPGIFARNAVSDAIYTGVNQIVLQFHARRKSFEINRWMTFLQAQKLGGKIKTGSRSFEVVYTSRIYIDANGRNVTAEVNTRKKEGKPYRDLFEKTVPFLKYFNVFNVAQIECLPDSFYTDPAAEALKNLTEPERIENAEEVISETGADIRFDQSYGAAYVPSSDYIKMPLRVQFTDPSRYYNVIFHELGHWTGHQTRLDRPKGNAFGSKEYAFEELIAELTSAFVCAALGIEKTITENADYIDSWLGVLESDKKFLISAASKAQAAADLIVKNEIKNGRQFADDFETSEPINV